MFMMTFYFSRVTDLTYAKSAPGMSVSYSASNDWLLLARLWHCHKGTYYGYKLTNAQTFGSGVGLPNPFLFLPTPPLKKLVLLYSP